MTEKILKSATDTIFSPETITAMEAARSGYLVKVGHPDRLIESLNAAQRPDVKTRSTR